MSDAPTPSRPPRRPRYRGKNPRRFEEKYKERDPQRYSETIAKVLASGKTPAGTHRPVMVQEILDVLAPSPGAIAVDCTLGYGGHAQEILARISPGGRLLGLDADPIELPKTEARLRSLGYEPETFSAHRSNFAGLPKVLAKAGLPGADLILADLGVSSMQIDDPSRGFSTKHAGPLDMRMNPARGQSASDFLRAIDAGKLARLLEENSDEPHAERLATALAGKSFPTTLRIAVNDEFSALDALLRQLPSCLNACARVAILNFHSGEDRRVKKSFEAGRDAGLYSQISDEVIRPSAAERNANPRSSSAKLRWACRAV
jgi:16S rRNA (cytosine1402-N4)-methyltransferase